MFSLRVWFVAVLKKFIQEPYVVGVVFLVSWNLIAENVLEEVPFNLQSAGKGIVFAVFASKKVETVITLKGKFSE